MHRLSDNSLFAAVELLIRRGTMVDHTSRLVSAYTHPFDPQFRTTEAMTVWWHRLIGALCTQQPVDLDLLLFRVIVDRGLAIEDHGPCDVLGADINARRSPGGTTALHRLCQIYPERLTRGSHRVLRREDDSNVVWQRFLLFGLLKKSGADPAIAIAGGQDGDARADVPAAQYKLGGEGLYIESLGDLGRSGEAVLYAATYGVS